VAASKSIATFSATQASLTSIHGTNHIGFAHLYISFFNDGSQFTSRTQLKRNARKCPCARFFSFSVVARSSILLKAHAHCLYLEDVILPKSSCIIANLLILVFLEYVSSTLELVNRDFFASSNLFANVSESLCFEGLGI
jgi:hypothetical protein